MIGDILRKERELQNLTIQDIEKGTSIRALYIEALEQGEYDKLPGEVYAKGFIKNYGNFLNLDGDDLVKKFIAEISPATAAPEDNAPIEKSAPEPKNIPAEEPAPVTKTRSQRRAEAQAAEENDDSRKKYIFIAAAALIFVLGGLIFAFSGSEENAVAKPEDPQTVDTQQVAQVTPEIPAPTPEPAPMINDVNVQATFSDDCWTQVIIDGSLVFEGIINAGQVFDWTGSQSVNVVLGNAGAANFVMNGQNIGAIGAEGAVVERTFTR